MSRMLSDTRYGAHGIHGAICVQDQSTGRQTKTRLAAERGDGRCSRGAYLTTVNHIHSPMNQRKQMTDCSQRKPRSKLAIYFLMPRYSSCADVQLH
jgi:hypothetical protein